VIGTDAGLRSTALGDSLTRSGHAAVEVHSVNANTRVIFDAKINVFANTETEVASLREVAFLQFIFLDLEATFEGFPPPWDHGQ